MKDVALAGATGRGRGEGADQPHCKAGVKLKRLRGKPALHEAVTWSRPLSACPTWPMPATGSPRSTSIRS
jgi:hypothetical protein